jgi:NADPH:quinone reductase-like Zn-dependent oxidoreductase
MFAAPINPSDLIFLKGQNPLSNSLPAVPGFEGSGTVVEVGPGALSKKLLGKRVALRAKPGRGGTWAEYVITDAERCVPLLPKVSLLEGASLLINPLTAFGLIRFAQEEGHRTAIQTAAASAVGKMMIRYAKKRKFPLINIVRRSEQVKELKAMGARWVLNSSEPDFPAQLQALSHKLGAKLVFDAVAGDFSETVLRAMPVGSELWSYGGLSEQPCAIDSMVLIYQQKRVRGMWLPPLMIAQGPKKFGAAMLEIQKNMKIFATQVRSVVPFEDFKQALTEYEKSMSGGKCLLSMSSASFG